MLHDLRFGFIGSGVMAEAMMKGLIQHANVAPDHIVASEPRQERGEELKSRYGVHSITDNVAAIDGAQIVVLSVKPQVMHGVLEQLAGRVVPDALVLSIVAGAQIETITGMLRHATIVRAMPNTPAQIGLGMTVWTCPSSLSESQRKQAQTVFGSFGEEVYVDDERYLDMATALSGTGPAYVFIFMEAMVDAGVHLGFHRSVSERLVAQTVRGSVDYYLKKKNVAHLASMRNQVTSPAGTTAAAVYYLEKAGFRTAISRAIWAAYERSQELGKDAKSQSPE